MINAQYNWYSVNTGKLAPANCHVPTYAEFQTLVTELGGQSVAGGHLKEAGTVHWSDPNTGADNSSGFTAISGGFRLGLDGSFGDIAISAYFHTSDDYNTASNVGMNLYSILESVGSFGTPVSWKKMGTNIRCLLDHPETWYSGMTITDIDGNVYGTVQIGDQVWLTENLKATHYNDGEIIPNVTDPSIWASLTTGAMCYYNNETPVVTVTPIVFGSLADFNEPFNIMFSIGDIRELSFGSANKSYTLNIPLTKLNKRLLKFVTQSDVKSEPTEIVSLYLDEQLIISGKMIVLSHDDYSAKVIINQDDWMDVIKKVKATALDFSAFDHLLTQANIEASWTATYPAYRYPMIFFGPLVSAETGPTAKWYPNDFIPMISIYHILIGILSGYTIVSEWLNSAYLKSKYILAKETIANDSFIRGKQMNVAVAGDLINSDTTSIPAGSSGNSQLYNIRIEFGTETTDEGGGWDNDTYTVPEDGTYKFKTSVTLLNNAPSNPSFTITSESATISIIHKRGAVETVLATISAAAYTGTELLQNIEYELTTKYYHMIAGDEVFVQLYINCNVNNTGGSPEDLTIGVKSVDSTFENIWNNVNKYAGINKNMSLEEMLPDVTQLDFLAAIRDIYNLRFWMDKSNKTLHIEPWDQFLTDQIVDITNLIDHDNPATEMISPYFSKYIDLKWKNDDSDEAYTEYLKENTNGPGLKQIVLTSEFCKSNIDSREHRFSSIITGKNSMIGEFLTDVPRIWNKVPNYVDLDYDRKVNFNTRIVHWDGLTAGFTWYFDASTKTSYPKISGLDWDDIYLAYWQKIFHKIDKGKLLPLRVRIKPAFLSQFVTKINNVQAENFRPKYKATINGIENYYRLQKITSDGELAELELFLE